MKFLHLALLVLLCFPNVYGQLAVERVTNLELGPALSAADWQLPEIRQRYNRTDVILRHGDRSFSLLNLPAQTLTPIADPGAQWSYVAPSLRNNHTILLVSDEAQPRTNKVFGIRPDGSLYVPEMNTLGTTFTDYNLTINSLQGDNFTGVLELAGPGTGVPRVFQINEEGNFETILDDVTGQYSNQSRFLFTQNRLGAISTSWESPIQTWVYNFEGGNADLSFFYEGRRMTYAADGVYIYDESCVSGEEEDLLPPTAISFIPEDNPGNVIQMCSERAIYIERGDQRAVVGGRLIFVGRYDFAGKELFVADPLLGTITILKDISDSNDPADAPRLLFTNNGKMYFSATDEEHGRELWVTDGTAEGTRFYSDINPGPADSNPEYGGSSWLGSFPWMGFRYFPAETAAGIELHRVSLTEENAEPELAVDINPGPGGSYPGNFIAVGDDLYFTAYDSPDAPLEYFRLIGEGNLTGGGDGGETASFAAFPNPVVAGQDLTVRAPAGEAFSTIQLVSATGQVVRQADLFQQSISTVDMDGLPVGVYWLRANYVSGETGVTAVVKE